MSEKKIIPSAASVHLALAVVRAASRGELNAAYEAGGFVARASWTLKFALDDRDWTGATATCPPFGSESHGDIDAMLLREIKALVEPKPEPKE